MATFQLRGTITEKPKKTIFNNIPVIQLLVREITNDKVCDFKVQFTGNKVKEIPQDIDILGAEVFITGSIVSKTNLKGTYTYLHGNQLSILYIPSFENDNS